jgi:alpha-N-arabinofuranosidase
VPSVHGSAARTADGAVIVALVNLDPNRAANVSAQIAGAEPESVSGRILTAEAMDAQNSFDDPAAVAPAPFTGARLEGGRLVLTLPAKSIVVLKLQ